jgi:hypothetical protein
MKYREAHTEEYNQYQLNYYHTKKEDPEWRAKLNERCRINNQKQREKKRNGEPPKPRGRPKLNVNLYKEDI